ncbi:hypothetical protein KR49_00035 [Synechococcus sp. KORDI-49]|nr:hypothetical protein KR49_00035 [Synechococcus sp. KORDI-49]
MISPVIHHLNIINPDTHTIITPHFPGIASLGIGLNLSGSANGECISIAAVISVILIININRRFIISRHECIEIFTLIKLHF